MSRDKRQKPNPNRFTDPTTIPTIEDLTTVYEFLEEDWELASYADIVEHTGLDAKIVHNCCRGLAASNMARANTVEEPNGYVRKRWELVRSPRQAFAEL